MLERRISGPRQRVFKAATLEFKNGGGVSGLVKNLSGSGATLQVENVLGIPDEFYLVIGSDHFKRACRTAWRKPNRIGVKFL